MATVYINNQHHGKVNTRPTNLGMAQRDQDFVDALSSGSGFGFTLQADYWNTGFIIDDFNVPHDGIGTLGLHAKRFEYGSGLPCQPNKLQMMKAVMVENDSM